MYDTKCHDLAKSFLEDEKLDAAENVAELAQEIQDTIEDFIASKICAECGHPLVMHDEKHGCEYESDGWVTGNQPEQPTVLMARPCGCRGELR